MARGGPHRDGVDERDKLIVNGKPDGTLTSIEETQAALRESIETARQLAEKSDFLLQKHKQKIEQDAAAAALDVYLRQNPD